MPRRYPAGLPMDSANRLRAANPLERVCVEYDRFLLVTAVFYEFATQPAQPCLEVRPTPRQRHPGRATPAA